MSETTKRSRTTFRHPALDEIDAEKAALRTILRAIAPMDGDSARRVLLRAADTIDANRPSAAGMCCGADDMGDRD